MKKLLAAVLAAAMTLSMGVASFATDPDVAIGTDHYEVDLSGTTFTYHAADNDVQRLVLTVDDHLTDSTKHVFTSDLWAQGNGGTSAEAAKMFLNAVSADGNYKVVDVEDSKLFISYKDVGDTGATSKSVTVSLAYVNSGSGISSSPSSADFVAGSRGTIHTEGKSNTFALAQFVFCDADRSPVAYVESGKENDQDGVRSGEKIYFVFRSMALTDEDAFKVKISKGENAKQVSSIKLLEKKFNNGLVPLLDPDVENTAFAGERISVVEVALKEIYTDDEFKIDFDMTFTAKEDVTIRYSDDGIDLYDLEVADGEKFKIDSTGKFWMKNSVDETDSTDYEGGRKGYVIKPTKNEDNDYTWNNENDDIALLEFEADDDVVKVYAKLSTVWDNQDYAEYFADSDAFFYNFVSNPVISSTSRALLTIYNPFIDEDDELSVDADDIKVYEVVDGELVDSKMTLGENEDGDSVFTLKTRQLGTYIIAGPKGAGVEEAPTAVPTGLVLPSRG